MSQVYNDNEALDAPLAAGAESLGYAETGASAGMDPEISSALDEGNRESDAEVDRAKEDADKTRKGSRDLEDTDEDNGESLDGIGTELSSGSGGGAGAGAGGLGSPMFAAQPPMQPMPMQPMPMPQMSPPQMPQMSQVPQGMYKMPAEMFKSLAGNMKPSSELSGSPKARNNATGSSGSVSPKDELKPGEVRFDKTGKGVLTDSELARTIDKALDLNGVSKDPEVRQQWHEVYNFMAEHESSRNPDAVNLTDSNAREYPDGPWAGTRAADGHPTMSSRGIWQTIPSTFAQNHVSGTSNNIYDPVASAASSIRYVMGKYDVDPAGGASLQEFYSNRMRGGYTGY